MPNAPLVALRAPAPAPGARVAPADDDGTIVLYDEPAARLHVLDPLAGLVWSCFDGVSTVDEIAADFADVFHTDESEARAAVVSVVVLLAERGLLVEGAERTDA